MSISVFLVVEP